MAWHACYRGYVECSTIMCAQDYANVQNMRKEFTAMTEKQALEKCAKECRFHTVQTETVGAVPLGPQDTAKKLRLGMREIRPK